jgi:hypothetical protein
MMEEALMDQKYLRRRILEQRVRDYLDTHTSYKDTPMLVDCEDLGTLLITPDTPYQTLIWCDPTPCPVEIPILKGD